METTLWWCPDCQLPTGNWTTCKACGKPAVHQRFTLTPIPDTEQVMVARRQVVPLAEAVANKLIKVNP